ncbi:MAG TPA: hypothetical protein VFY71_04140 [Planctomycetota bacterium]|nr:hypothetical protein [Planctomycetota bacterium]
MRSLRPLALVTVFAAGALLVALARPAAPATAYRVVRYAGIDISQGPEQQDKQAAALEAQLNGYAGQGWELAFVQGGFAVLKQ